MGETFENRSDGIIEERWNIFRMKKRNYIDQRFVDLNLYQAIYQSGLAAKWEAAPCGQLWFEVAERPARMLSSDQGQGTCKRRCFSMTVPQPSQKGLVLINSVGVIALKQKAISLLRWKCYGPSGSWSWQQLVPGCLCTILIVDGDEADGVRTGSWIAGH